jgi:hypothetical protein
MLSMFTSLIIRVDLLPVQFGQRVLAIAVSSITAASALQAMTTWLTRCWSRRRPRFSHAVLLLEKKELISCSLAELDLPPW